MEDNKPQIGDIYTKVFTFNGIETKIRMMYNGVEWVRLEDD